MLTTYFTRERTRATYAASPAGPYLDDFSHWLEKRGFTTRTIRRCLFGATQFTAWAEAAGIAVQSLDATSLEVFCGYLTQHDQRRYASGNPTPRCMGAHHFLTFLRAQGVTSAPAVTAPSAAFPTLLNEFQHWMEVHRGCHRADPSQLPTYSPRFAHGVWRATGTARGQELTRLYPASRPSSW